MLHGQKLGCGSQVVIPKIMMNGLEVPKIFARASVKRQQAIAEKTGAGTIRAKEVIGRRSQREVSDSTLFVDSHPAPVIGAANVLPGILRPGVVTKFAGVGNGMKDPDHLPAEHVIGTNIARRGSVLFPSGRTQNQEILKDPSWAAGLNGPNRLRITTQALPQIGTAMVAERIHQLAGARVQRMEHVVGGVEEAAVAAILALPVIDSAVGDASGNAVVVNPDLLAGHSVESNRGIIFPHHVH